MILLVVFGFVYNGMLRDGFANLRMASVLSQIGIAYFLAAIITINTNSVKTRMFWVIGILLGIAAMQLLVTIDGYGGGVLTADGSINSWLDQHFLPGKLYRPTYDPEGVLCIISASSVTLMGAIAGTIIRSKKYTQHKKTIILLISGITLVGVALLLSPVYPIIKKQWTVPFNLLTAGISFLLLATFYYIIDVMMLRNWIFFFRVIGLNSITIYMGRRIIDFEHASEFLFGWTGFMGEYGTVIIAIGVIVLEWLMLYYFFKKKIFLRV